MVDFLGKQILPYKTTTVPNSTKNAVVRIVSAKIYLNQDTTRLL